MRYHGRAPCVGVTVKSLALSLIESAIGMTTSSVGGLALAPRRHASEQGAPAGHRWIGRGWARMHYGLRVEPTWLELTNLPYRLPTCPSAFDGFRIAHLSDFHCSRHVTPAFVSRGSGSGPVLKPLTSWCLTGDFIHHGFRLHRAHWPGPGPAGRAHGVFAVLGNHDYSVRNALGLSKTTRISTGRSSGIKHERNSRSSQ